MGRFTRPCSRSSRRSRVHARVVLAAEAALGGRMEGDADAVCGYRRHPGSLLARTPEWRRRGRLQGRGRHLSQACGHALEPRGCRCRQQHSAPAAQRALRRLLGTAITSGPGGRRVRSSHKSDLHPSVACPDEGCRPSDANPVASAQDSLQPSVAGDVLGAGSTSGGGEVAGGRLHGGVLRESFDGTELTELALEMAMWHRRADDLGGLVRHSDRGVQPGPAITSGPGGRRVRSSHESDVHPNGPWGLRLCSDVHAKEANDQHQEKHYDKSYDGPRQPPHGSHAQHAHPPPLPVPAPFARAVMSSHGKLSWFSWEIGGR